MMNIIMGSTIKELTGISMLTLLKMIIPLIFIVFIQWIGMVMFGNLIIECRQDNMSKNKIGTMEGIWATR